ncbi:25S rRNA (adenine(645)-N(1))-methyltransferase [Lecanosticta acicola]|uniref:Ribosomal RNA-processing protein 8 n=1 Tax=Lecanosticta acicola TaxID=111012 RepID=A0AAI8Z5C2_9PEZI|nr:25S rRNA (adenine(645)-N(1))-methyltransferase [Lecanosticta acicola]
MFAVKGWNVDASNLKPQTAVFKAAADNVDSKNKKRKRDGEHMEAKKKKLKKEKKREKLAATNANYAPMGESKWKPKEEVEGNEPGQTTTGAQDEKAQHEEMVGADEKPGKKNKRRKKKDKQQTSEEKADGEDTAPKDIPEKASKDSVSAAPPVAPPLPKGAKLTPMQAAMRQKLVSARFRHLNQTLYTEPSAKALNLFDQNPEMFEDYHSGFRQQVAVWPENPVDNFIATIRSRGDAKLPSQKKAFKGKNRKPAAPEDSGDGKSAALPRTHGTCIIADLGCGDARLAQTLKSSNDGQNLQLKVLSYDLHSPSPLVTKADISNIPAADGSVDVAIFCLALMGTNWISFIEEAYRILHWKGELWVAEIKSRFGRVSKAGKPVEHSVGGKRRQAAIKKAQEAKKSEQEEVDDQQALAVEVDGAETKNQETDVSAFVDVLKRRGFLLKNGESSIDLSNKMFVKMEFVKAATPTKGKNEPDETAKPAERFKKSKAKFLEEDDDDVATDDETKVLKPCLYKIR